MIDYCFKFDDIYKKDIRDGSKTNTIRLEEKPVNIDDIAYAKYTDNRSCEKDKIEIIGIKKCKFSDLSAYDVTHHNNKIIFETFCELKKYYPDLDLDTIVYIYEFEYICDADEDILSIHYFRNKPYIQINGTDKGYCFNSISKKDVVKLKNLLNEVL